MHGSQSHHSHFGGNGLGNTPSRVHSGSSVPSDVLPCRCFYKLLCCSLGSELFPFPSREGNAAGSSCAQKRKTQHKRNRNHREQSKGSLISYGLVSCVLSRLWPFLFSSVTSPDCPTPASLLPLVLALAFVCVCQPNNPCSRSEILVTAQSGRAKVQAACKTRSRLGARCACVQRGHPMGQARTASTSLLPKTGIWVPPPQTQSSSHRYLSHRPTSKWSQKSNHTCRAANCWTPMGAG